jgi:hypothetical protein
MNTLASGDAISRAPWGTGDKAIAKVIQPLLGYECAEGEERERRPEVKRTQLEESLAVTWSPFPWCACRSLLNQCPG